MIVDAGLKSEGVIPIQEFQIEGGPPQVAVGDHVEVALETVEDGFGETRFSKEKAERIRTWDRLTKAFEKKASSAPSLARSSGGFTVDIGTVRAFLPGSLVDIRPVRDTGYLVKASPSNSRSSSSTACATTWSCRAVRCSKPNTAPSAIC